MADLDFREDVDFPTLTDPVAEFDVFVVEEEVLVEPPKPQERAGLHAQAGATGKPHLPRTVRDGRQKMASPGSSPDVLQIMDLREFPGEAHRHVPRELAASVRVGQDRRRHHASCGGQSVDQSAAGQPRDFRVGIEKKQEFSSSLSRQDIVRTAESKVFFRFHKAESRLFGQGSHFLSAIHPVFADKKFPGDVVASTGREGIETRFHIPGTVVGNNKDRKFRCSRLVDERHRIKIQNSRVMDAIAGREENPGRRSLHSFAIIGALSCLLYTSPSPRDQA
eukprot:TRINITY_DN27085_c0_g1_i3.p7 TRINITY_DN27085_c0_g1~~TRINITY_DN27085_c0_g1_i3.p7  ORF type:complete len:279 (-),score=-24.03 TRINITY_DN27085_c0_g1_i3:104-940(-)